VTTFDKDPQAVLDYRWDWADWMAVNDSITTHLVTVTGGIVLGTHSHDTNSVTAWLSGGTAGTTATATCRITTTQGRTDDRTIWLRVKER
jgi:hypothetical protein